MITCSYKQRSFAMNKYGRSCFLCKNKAKNPDKSSVSFHKFPKNINLRSRWIEACGLNEETDDVSSLHVCSNHFEASDYADINARESGGTLRLRFGAIPSRKQKSTNLKSCFTEDPSLATICDLTGTQNDDKEDVAPKEKNLPTPPVEENLFTRKKCMVLKLAASFTVEDFDTPTKAMKNFQILRSALERRGKQIRLLQRSVRRLKKNVTSLKRSIADLGKKSINANNYDDTLDNSILEEFIIWPKNKNALSV